LGRTKETPEVERPVGRVEAQVTQVTQEILVQRLLFSL
jgi:hypothetical protein